MLSNYTITNNTADFTIDPKAASVTPNAASKTYGDPDPTFTGTLVSFLAADGVTATYSRTLGETVERNMTPERIRIEYIRLAAADLAKDIRVSEDDVRKAMTEGAASAAGKEERRASHILIKLPQDADAQAEKASMAKAQDLRAKLLAGADFATLARKNSEDPGSAAQGGDLGFVARGALAKEFEQALFALRSPAS